MFLPQLSAVTDPAPAAEGYAQFVAVLPEGLVSDVAPEEVLGENRHPLSPLFHVGHEVITQIRLLDA